MGAPHRKRRAIAQLLRIARAAASGTANAELQRQLP
jgi:hypothetical protein